MSRITLEEAKKLWINIQETDIKDKIIDRAVERASKYNAKKTDIDWIRFDSKKEANRYKELKLLEKSWEITGLLLQPEFILQRKFERQGKCYRPIIYKADFLYYKDWKQIVEDVKWFKTDVYNIKKKLLLYKYNLEFKEI